MSKELIHLMTDASFCSIAQVGTFGFQFTSPLGQIKGGCGLSNNPKDSLAAELGAILEALNFAERCNLLVKNAVLIVHCDNLSVVNYLGGGAISRADLTALLDSILGLAYRFKLKIVSRHVKGHAKKKDRKQRLQHYCDTIARKQLRKVKVAA